MLSEPADYETDLKFWVGLKLLPVQHMKMRKSVETCRNSTLKVSQDICGNFNKIALNNTINS